MDNRNQALPKGTILRGKVYTYRIEKVLGQGTFGITYLASTSMHGPLGEVTVQVAVKEFFAKELDSRMADGTVTARTEDGVAHKYARAFLRESENLSKMKHPGIVNVLESFEDKGTCYYSMEYLSGGSLDDKVKDTGLPEDEALPLIERIGDALSYMHERRVMHLDLKPKNIMLKADGTPVIIDFGISKQYDGNGEPESSTTIGLGTPGYAPIEQATQTSGRTFQPTLDIYAFGATSFKMLTGNTPPNATEIFNEGFPEDLLQQKNVSSKTIKAIRKAMSAAKKDRPQSVDDYLTLLKEKSPDSVDSPAWFGLNAGTKLQNGKYEIIRILGQNELETTYLAKRVSDHHKVVIKELYEDFDFYKDFYKKLINEVQMMAGMKHRYLVNIHEVFNEKGTAYYVMEYLPGGSLEDEVKKNGPMSEKLAEKYVRQISDALAFLHERDMVLLNVEPAHILLNAKGEAVIINPSLTIFKANSLLNSDEGIEMPASTPHPFQGIEYPKSERPSADIYSLGATLYYLLSGVIPPYPYDVFDKGLERPEGISERMWCAIEKAMQPKPKDRPQTISDFMSLLGDDQDRTIHQPSPKPEPKPTSVSAPVSGSIGSPRFEYPVWWMKYAMIGGITLFVVLLLALIGSRLKKQVPDRLLINGLNVCKVEIDSAETECVFKIEKNFGERWTYSGVPEWCTAKAETGKITLFVSENKTKESRTAAIVFRKKEGKDVLGSLIINQKASKANKANSISKKKEQETTEKKVGSIRFASTPSGAAIWIDGKNTNKTTPAIIDGLTVGKHNVKLVLDGYNDYSGIVTVSSKKRMVLDRSLAKTTNVDKAHGNDYRVIDEEDIYRKKYRVEVDDEEVEEEAIPFALVEEKPKFQGGDANTFSSWVNANLQYPEIAKENGIQGRVTLQFTVNTDGSVSDVKVLRGVDSSLDEEAVRIVSMSPMWTPGKQRERPVKVVYNFPVVFQFK